MTWLTWLDVLRQDIGFAARSMRRGPALTILIVLTFALGIGVNAASFTLLDRIYLRPPAGVAEPDEVRRLWFLTEDSRNGVTPGTTFPVLKSIRASWTDPSQVAFLESLSDVRLGGTLQSPEIDVEYPTANYFAVLGVRPQLGRFFTPDEDRVGSGAPVAVLSDVTWRRHFGADSGVIGREIKLEENRYTVIGVTAPGFTGIDLEPAGAWVPIASYPDQNHIVGPIAHRMFGLRGFARVAAGPDVIDFERRATLAARETLKGSGIGDTTVRAVTGSIIYARGPGEQQQAYIISTRLSAVSAIVLVIAAANIVNLLLARAARRRREIAVRLALGVGRSRLVRMLTTETLLLALLGAGAALLAAWWGGSALRALVLPDVTFVDGPVDSRVVWFTLAVAAAAGLASGIIPALQSSNPDLTRALKEGAKSGGVHHSRLRAGLVVIQAALSVVLLVGASLFVRSLQNVRGLDLGFDVNRVLIATVRFDPGQAPPLAERGARIAEVAQRVEGRPGIEMVSRSGHVPMGGASYMTVWFANDSTASLGDNFPAWHPVDERFFETVGQRIVKGRVFDNRAGGARQVVVDEALAAVMWPGQEPIGQCMRFEGRSSTCYAVVGVVEPARNMSVIEERKPQYYLPIANLPEDIRERYENATVLLVRTTPQMAVRVQADVAGELKRAFPTGYPNARLMLSTLDRDYRPWRVGALLFSGFGALALIVAILGIYSTVSYGVSQRTHEFGIRVALGARVADVLRLVVRDGLRTVAIGVAAGALLAVAAGRLVSALLYDVKPSDPAVLVGVSLSLLAVAVLATLGPAWRATRVDPTTALRSE